MVIKQITQLKMQPSTDFLSALRFKNSVMALTDYFSFAWNYKIIIFKQIVF